MCYEGDFLYWTYSYAICISSCVIAKFVNFQIKVYDD